MALKTDYKDALYGRKCIRLEENDDGTLTPSDETEYTQTGDKFGAKDINETNAAINRLYDTPIPVTLTAAGWIGDDVPYVQTAVAEGILATDNPGLVSMLADGAAGDVQKAYAKAFGIISSGTGTTGGGTATFKVYKKPATDITVGLKL